MGQRVEGEDVGLVAGGDRRVDGEGGEVDLDELGVAIARDEGSVVVGIDL